MALNWTRHKDSGGTATLSETSLSQEWDEVYSVLRYVPPDGVPGWFGLIVDRPWLSPGSIHPTVLSAYVTKFQAERIGSSDAWDVIVSYRVGDPKAFDLPPTQRPAVIEVSTESVEVATFKKANGDP